METFLEMLEFGLFLGALKLNKLKTVPVLLYNNVTCLFMVPSTPDPGSGFASGSKQRKVGIGVADPDPVGSEPFGQIRSNCPDPTLKST